MKILEERYDRKCLVLTTIVDNQMKGPPIANTNSGSMSVTNSVCKNDSISALKAAIKADVQVQ